MAATPQTHAHHCVGIHSDGLNQSCWSLLSGQYRGGTGDSPVQAFDSSVTDDTERLCALEQSLIDPQYT